MKGLQSSKITQYFLEGEGPTLKKQQVEKKQQQKKQNEIIKNFMAPFYEWGSTASRLEPLFDERLSRPWSHPMVFSMQLNRFA